jgi:predicted aspartyl protease
MTRASTTLFSLLILVARPILADGPDVRIALQPKSTSTYYVMGAVDGLAIGELLLDTGSGYVALNRETFDRLKAHQRPRFVKTLDAVMADGSEARVPVYHLARLELGETCIIRDVEAAILPSGSRNILGMSALHKASPFTISVSPPALTLSNCTGGFSAES